MEYPDISEHNCLDTRIRIGSIPENVGTDAKERLAHALIQHFQPGFSINSSGLKIKQDSQGRPRVNVPDISISFSHCSKVLYGALAKTATLGIDAATASEFEGSYPHDRVFHKNERTLVQKLCSSPADSAAFLWACKEAVVKAMGTGFRSLEPYDVKIISCSSLPGGAAVEVCAIKNYMVRVFRCSKNWIAVAV